MLSAIYPVCNLRPVCEFEPRGSLRAKEYAAISFLCSVGFQVAEDLGEARGAGSAAMRSQHPVLARPAKQCLGAVAAVSWHWVPACGSLEPSCRVGENAPKTGKDGEKMGEIRSKTREGVAIT